MAAASETAGQADLDKATELKVTAESLGDLEKVAKLCESALQKGLDEGNQKFAKQLLTSTLYQHADPAVRADLRPGSAGSPLADVAAVRPEGLGAGH